MTEATARTSDGEAAKTVYPRWRGHLYFRIAAEEIAFAGSISSGDVVVVVVFLAIVVAWGIGVLVMVWRMSR